MRRALAGRVMAYLVVGSAAALGILAVQTFPQERTWIAGYRGWRWDRDHRPRTLHVDCGWRIVLCEELPSIEGPLKPVWDSATAGLDAFDCGFTFFTTCGARKADTLVSILIDDSPEWVVVSRSWAPPQRDSAYEQLAQEMTGRYGTAYLCPQSDDLYFTEDRQWRSRGRVVGLVKAGRDRIELNTHEGRIGCHLGP